MLTCKLMVVGVENPPTWREVVLEVDVIVDIPVYPPKDTPLKDLVISLMSLSDELESKWFSIATVPRFVGLSTSSCNSAFSNLDVSIISFTFFSASSIC